MRRLAPSWFDEPKQMPGGTSSNTMEKERRQGNEIAELTEVVEMVEMVEMVELVELVEVAEMAEMAHSIIAHIEG
jgi:hypothetical protein